MYEVRPRKDHRGVDLISDALPFGRLWYGEPNAEMTMTARGLGCTLVIPTNRNDRHRHHTKHKILRLVSKRFSRFHHGNFPDTLAYLV